MFLQRGIVFSHETVDEWEAKLTPMTHEVRQRRRGRAVAGRQSLHVDETYLKVRGRWCYFYRAIDREGALVDTVLSEHRDMAARRHSFAPRSPPPAWSRIGSLRMDTAPVCTQSVSTLGRHVEHREVKKRPAGARPSGRERRYRMYAWLQGIRGGGAMRHACDELRTVPPPPRITSDTSLPTDAVCFTPSYGHLTRHSPNCIAILPIPNQVILHGAKAETTESRAKPSSCGGMVNKGRV